MDLLETFSARCEALLGKPGSSAASQARAALRERGFDADVLDGLPLGLYTTRAEVRQGLVEAGFSNEAIEAAKVLADVRLPGRLIGPIREPEGRIVSFWARHPSDRHRKDLFLRGDWKQLVPLYGLDIALRAADSRGLLVIVEDQLDALLFHAHGMRYVAAIAGPFREMTAARWNRLARLPFRAAVLAPDSRAPADRHEEILEVLRQAFRAPAAPEIFVLPPCDLCGAAGPADFLRRHGRVEFQALLEHCCISAGQYKAQAVHLPVWEVPGQPEPAPPVPPPALPPEPYVSEEPPVSPPPATTRVRRSGSRNGFCEIHRCAEGECFCFD